MLNGGPNVANGAFQLPVGNWPETPHETMQGALAHSNSACHCVETSISTAASTCNSAAMCSTSRTVQTLDTSFPTWAISFLVNPLSP